MTPLTEDIANAWYSDDFGGSGDVEIESDTDGSGELELESDTDECLHDDYSDE